MLLAAALEVAGRAERAGHAVVLAASDQRLLNAAQAEGLTGFNPEAGTIAQLDALIAAPGSHGYSRR